MRISAMRDSFDREKIFLQVNIFKPEKLDMEMDVRLEIIR